MLKPFIHKHKITFRIISGLLFILSLVLAILWAGDNNGPYEPFLAITSLLTTFIGSITIWDIVSQNSDETENIKPEIFIKPTETTHGFLIVDDKNKADGKFKVEGSFWLSVGKTPIDILSISGEYLVNGKNCLPKESRTKINKPVIDSSKWETLDSPVRLDAGQTTQFWYSRLFQPPKTEQYPYQCEEGILKISIKFKSPAAFESYNQFFCFETSRRWDLTPVDCDNKD